MKIHRFAGAMAAALVLAGCNGGGASVQGSQQAGANSDMTPMQTFDNNHRDLNDLPNTAFRGIPSRGTARFDGAAQITIDPTEAGQGRRRFVGEVDVTVDFRREGLAGQIDNFVARGDGRTVNGQVYITQGRLGVNRPNDFAADYIGTLRDNGDRIRVDSTMLGDFRGTPIRGVAASNTGEGVWVNGTATRHDFEMFLLQR